MLDFLLYATLFPSLLYPIRSAATVEENAKASIEGFILEKNGFKKDAGLLKLRSMLRSVSQQAITQTLFFLASRHNLCDFLWTTHPGMTRLYFYEAFWYAPIYRKIRKIGTTKNL